MIRMRDGKIVTTFSKIIKTTAIVIIAMVSIMIKIVIRYILQSKVSTIEQIMWFKMSLIVLLERCN